jgi:hypothetical protein
MALAPSALKPLAVLSIPVVLAYSASAPVAVFEEPGGVAIQRVIAAGRVFAPIGRRGKVAVHVDDDIYCRRTRIVNADPAGWCSRRNDGGDR